jgi:hypothetical protein
MPLDRRPHSGDYPHEGGCAECAAKRVCNVCGRPRRLVINPGGACTNGRCSDCHTACCTPGGNTDPGHGFGSPDDAKAQADRIRKAAR